MTTRDPLDYGWWLAGRSAGIVAFLLLSASVVLGLLMAARLLPPRARAAAVAWHERIALLALAALAAHGLFLLADPWLRPGVTGLLVPFTIDYRPLWTGLGVCGAYLAAGLSLTYYARRRLGARRWRKAHRAIPVAWALGAVHALGAGTDAGSLWLQAPIAVTVALVVVLLARRLTMRRPSAPARTRARVPAPARDPEPRTSKAPAPAALWLGSPQNRA